MLVGAYLIKNLLCSVGGRDSNTAENKKCCPTDFFSVGLGLCIIILHPSFASALFVFALSALYVFKFSNEFFISVGAWVGELLR